MPETSHTSAVQSEDTGGVVSMIEDTVPARREGPPLHHQDFDETFSVLAGELTFQVRTQLLAARAGDTAFAARGGHHTLANVSDEEARYLRMAAEQAGVAPPPEADLPYPPTTVAGAPIGRSEA